MQYLAQIPFTEAGQLARSEKTLVILPVGVVEEHGAHLPLGLDSFAAEAYARSAAPHLEARGYQVLVAPTINYGVALQALSFPGTLSLQPDTLRSLVADVGRSLARHGFRRLIILNGHRDATHMKTLDEAGGILAREKSAEVLCVGFASDPAVTAACYREGVRQYYRSPQPDREGHGGESETSVALYCFPELVRQELLGGLEPNFDYDVEAFRNETQDYWTLTGGRGYFGAPQAAHAETGKKLVSIRGRNIAQVVLNAWGAP